MILAKAAQTLSGKMMLTIKCEKCNRTFMTIVDTLPGTELNDTFKLLERDVAVMKCLMCEEEELK